MNPTMLEKRHILKREKPILFLSIFALVFTVLGFLTYFVRYVWKPDGLYLEARFPEAFNLINLLFHIAPSALFVFYLLKFRSKLKATIFVPIVFACLGLITLFEDVFGYEFGGARFPYELYRILDLLILACVIPAVISALKGFNKKTFVIFLLSVCLLYEILALREMVFFIRIFYIPENLYLYVFTSLFSVIGPILLYTALLLFCLKSKIPSIISSSKKEKAELTPEQALKLLKDKLDLDMITEEEYQAQRAEIISKL